MQVIITKYHGPTNNLGARISVFTKGEKRKTYSRRFDCQPFDQERQIAREYAAALGRLVNGRALVPGYTTDPNVTIWTVVHPDMFDPEEQDL